MKEIRKELLEELLGDEGLLKALQKALMERAFGAELTVHLGYEKGDPGGRGSGNNRNGHGRKGGEAQRCARRRRSTRSSPRPRSRPASSI